MEFDPKQYKQGQKLLEEAAKKLQDLTGNLGKNLMLAKAKEDHLGKMQEILETVLLAASESKVDFTDKTVRAELAGKFVEQYDTEVLTPLGM
ncbi:MAG: hypothetical protein H8E12_15350 [Rhodobacteraceae bacterium]|nr:hypothetical protein [Paracoccaceae bacterium]